ncbi:MAG TPA: FAD-binding protein [Wenzhouxiangella sp.]|nr:FAD-binding protein [Wenzhouxiangella sp.]
MSRFDPIESLTDEESLAHYGRDWTRFWPARPSAVVFPRSTEEVAALVRQARRDGLKLVPSGGRTGLSGGAVASSGEVVVSLEKMREVIDLSCRSTGQAGMGSISIS